MKVKNSEAASTDTLHIKCAAKATTPESGPPKLTFQGYSGNSVDLSDYGFDYPVVYNVAGIETKQAIPIRYNHGEAVGHTTSVRKVDNGSAVRGKGLASLPGPTTDRIIGGIKNGFPWEASMGLRIGNFSEDIRLHDKGSIQVNNRTFTGPIYIVNRCTLTEMTICESGRDSDTSFEYLNQEKRMIIKNATNPPTDPPKDTPPKDIEKKDTLPTDPPVDPPKDPPPAPPKVENQMPNTLDPVLDRSMTLLNKFPGTWDMIKKGIHNGWDDEAIENSIKLHELNKNLPTPPSPQRKGGDEYKNQLLVNTALSFGVQPEFLAKKFDPKVVDNATERSQMTIGELLVNAANISGGNYDGFSDMENVCKFLKNTGYSTFDLPDFFEKVGSIVKEQRWELNPPFAPTVCKEGSNKDFRPTQRIRINGGDMWDQVAHDGKLPLYSTGNQKRYSTELETYGTLFTITRREVINDDMGALQDMMDMMVEGATIIPDYLLGLKMINQLPAANSFWIDDDNSVDNKPLTEANLDAAFTAIRQYTEVKDRINWNVMLNERWTLIVSPALEKTAWNLLKQDYIVNDTTADTKTGSKNYWYGRMDIKVFGQMANTAAFPSGSKFVGDKTWILWPSSLKFAPYEITYLRGQKRPIIESVDLPAELLGFGTRGYWDVNVNERERTAVARYTGTA